MKLAIALVLCSWALFAYGSPFNKEVSEPEPEEGFEVVEGDIIQEKPNSFKSLIKCR